MWDPLHIVVFIVFQQLTNLSKDPLHIVVFIVFQQLTNLSKDPLHIVVFIVFQQLTNLSKASASPIGDNFERYGEENGVWLGPGTIAPRVPKTLSVLRTILWETGKVASCVKSVSRSALDSH
ncbi:hypothetical protein J6590_039156 [Homalodisca vitripennis]|nr:hypothetical protein J6590_039156 [Homalodisca vitripennis]